MNFFKLYIGDYQRDTAHLSITEHGAYLLMLQHYYATEKPLPAGKALHRMLRAQEKDERDAIDRVVALFWRTTDDGLVNNRADKERAKSTWQAETNRATAIAREAARKEERGRHEQSTNRATNVHTKGPPRARNSHSQTTSLPSEEKNPPTPRKRGSVSGFPPGFETFWDAYPRKVGKDAAAKAFAKRRFTVEQLAAVVAAVETQRRCEAWTREDGRFIPHPSTWLNEGRWQDEISSATDPFAGAI